MKRLAPYLIFVLLTGGLVAFIYKDTLLPSAATDTAQSAAAGGQGGGRHGGHHRGAQIVPVVAEKVSTANVPVYLNGVGTVQAFNTATVRTQVSGRLIDVPYTEGQDVKEGDILAKVDPSLYQAAYDQAVAQKAKDEVAARERAAGSKALYRPREDNGSHPAASRYRDMDRSPRRGPGETRPGIGR